MPRAVRHRGARAVVPGECVRCHAGEECAPCTCTVQDRCAELNAKGHQCALGAGHTLKHVTVAGVYWR